MANTPSSSVMPCFKRSPLLGLPVILHIAEELPPRFSFCLKLLQDVSNIKHKHKDSVLLVAKYTLVLLVTPASPRAQWRVVPAKSSFFRPTSNFCNSETSPCPTRFATFLVHQLLSYKMHGTNNVEPSAGETKRTGG